MSRALHQQLKNPIVKADRRLRLWCLALQGYVDVDQNIESAKRSWSEVLGIATELGEQRWKARALGELGVIAFFEGNLTRAVRLVGDSVLSLAAGGDNAGVARLLTMAGYGFDPQRRFSEAKWFFIRAQALMQSTPDAGFPFGARIGYAEALAGEGDRSRARNLLYDALTEARFEKDSFHEADILIVLGEIASETRELELAKLYFKQAATIAHKLKLYRTSALAMSDLASVYRIQGKFAHADATVQLALKADHHLGDRYYMPRDLTAAAELKIAENQPRQAELLFEEAEGLTDGVMRYQHADYGNAALSGAMSETYLQHFHLLQQEGSVTRAFRLLERVRGRILATRMYEHRKAPPASPARETIEANIAAIQVKLMANEDQQARLALDDQLL
jgi:tetratricopeptide (TPR) repeat protein